MSVEGYELGFFDRKMATERRWQQSVDLMLGAFSWPVARDRLVEVVETDPRSSTDPIGTYALDGDGALVGYVGMARRPLVLDGSVVSTGHIWSVAVQSDHTRRGLGTTLLSMALDQYRAEGIDDVTLYTTKALVAYELYRELGFRDHHRHIWWMGERRGVEGAVPLRALEEGELDGLLELFNRNLGGLDGFSRRQGDLLHQYNLFWGTTNKWFVTVDPPGSLEGYVVLNPGPLRGLTQVVELVGPDTDWYRQAARAVVAFEGGSQVLVAHRNPAAAPALEAEGFRWRDVRAYELMMSLGGAMVPVDEGRASDPGWFLESRYDVF